MALSKIKREERGRGSFDWKMLVFSRLLVLDFFIEARLSLSIFSFSLGSCSEKQLTMRS
jgi:hypothetical protein